MIIATEEQEQRAVIEWCELMTWRWPELARIFHIPNGGSRPRSEGARFQAVGVRAGVPDLMLPVPRGRFHGLWIEMKRAGGRSSDVQLDWQSFLDAHGYDVHVCHGAGEAIAAIERYMTS